MSESAETGVEKGALVTGAGTGIGAALERALSQEGYRVGIQYRPSEGALPQRQPEPVAATHLKRPPPRHE